MNIVIDNNPKNDLKQLIIPLSSGQPTGLQRIAEEAGISASLIEQDFKAEAGEVHVIYGSATRFLLLGLGKKKAPSDLARCFRTLSHKHSNKLNPQVTISFLHSNIEEAKHEAYIEAAANGLCLGTYKIGKFKSQLSNDQPHPLEADSAELTILTTLEADKALSAARKGQALAHTQMSIFDLVNAPSNRKTPRVLAEWALASGKQHGYKVIAMDKKQITALGLHALLAVNQGSPTPPYFIVMEYQPTSGKADRKVGLVGKGVTFDTGGLSIKPSGNMHLMKSDMGGAAAVLGTMEMAAKLQLPVHLIGIVPTTDNSVDADAVKPSDVIDSYSGKTIEIIDTDAEGRLILADGLAYMVKHFAPDVLIDLATLTGSAVRTFGYHAGALFSNDDELAEQISKAGNRTGERVWRLPIWEIYREDIKSDVADVRNYSGRPLAGAIGAAKFLETFIGDHPHWAHLDIAGVAFNDTDYSMQKSATAYGVRLLIDYLSTL